VADLLGKNLELNLHEVEIAYNYQSAFKKFISFAPNLVVMDVHLGDGDNDGRQLCKEIRRFNRVVPIILMSGRHDALNDHEQYGANDAIDKPFDMEALLFKIDKLLLT
jgi:DNA-binding response OmpR family regulator